MNTWVVENGSPRAKSWGWVGQSTLLNLSFLICKMSSVQPTGANKRIADGWAL